MSQTDLQRAVQYLEAYPWGRGRWAYDAREEGPLIRYILRGHEMRDLGRALRRGEPDAYSLWCAGTVPQRQTLAP